jgi:hypothetical protein
MTDSTDRMLLPKIVARKPRRLDLSVPRLKSFCRNSENLIEFSPEKDFQTFLYFERRRAARSKSCCALLLLEVSSSLEKSQIESLVAALQDSMRETDIAGWYKTGSVIGVVFTEVDPTNSAAISEILLNKTVGALSLRFPKEVMSRIFAKVAAFPENLLDEQQEELRSAAG